ncbi:GcrA family cell cycle regulator [Bradyrhizobium lablabi]|uniref:GcrA family cell cycle regulator n=1 Tax=Bradyrhizobium lablabi TaxID=722472 RepID=UPI001BAA31F6|nr:GcrA family cell cycle regulator [Bradyrhizobium lablabi]MBR0694789.1 hypothetical protein [Bradyrhizobium lablabi]
METTDWLPEHSAALRDLRARGMSYSAIADEINAKFNTSYTRNAALGRAQRMGLGSLGRPEPSLPGPQDIERPREPCAGPGTGTLQWPKSFAGKLEVPNLRCAVVEPRHLSLAELGRDDCRYPYGGDGEDEPITFCGHRRQPGSSYCTPHFELSRDPVLSAEPVLSAAWLRVVGAA